MSHAISIQAIEEHLFLLSQMATASKAYTEALLENFENDRYESVVCTALDYERMRYQAHLECLVSDYLIQCATRTRIIQDTRKIEQEGDYNPDTEAFEQFDELARCVSGNMKLSIREICNKIIHTTQFELEYIDLGRSDLKYWSGRCHLQGAHQGKPWHLELDVKQWAFALQHYYEVRE